MQCPSDGTVLVMSERSGIEIDYCPTCRGVWLDRGELDKIVERAGREFGGAPSAPAAPQAPSAPVPPQQPAYGQQAYQQPYDNRGYDNRGYDNRGYGDQGYGRKKKKESWLSELFD
ncbi:zf-TFIIB domain-containing protein [Agromyces lapidis]|uniref:Zf-TFIIB domain-containing protein n=1 Tax=Agromyces lapidis TaxID=279574 RepID=A0ABV5SLZ6_9MICO|nr:zf-TFIIB domain-containing protein [Agromyces lapidis]